MLDLALSLLLAAAPDAGCPWKDQKTPPQIESTVFSTVEFKVSNDPTWFRCAKKAGGTLELVWAVGTGGELVPKPPKPLTSYSESVSFMNRDICATPGPKQVQATLKGTGEMERLDWSSTMVEHYCPACQWRSGDFSLALFTKARTAPGTWTLETGFDEEWMTCAQKTGALELRIYMGNTLAEVREAKQPTHVVKLDASRRVKKQFSTAAICKGSPKFVGHELAGTGEFQVLPSMGRASQESQCP